MPPLSSTKHGHGTEVVALRGQTGPSSPHPHEFLPWKVHPWLLLHCPGFALTFLSYNRLQSWERGGHFHISSLHSPRVVLRWQRRGCPGELSTPALQSDGTFTARRLTEVNLSSKNYRLGDRLLSSGKY